MSHNPKHSASVSDAMKRKWEDPVWANSRNYKTSLRCRRPYKTKKRYADLTSVCTYVDEDLYTLIIRACDHHQVCKSELLRTYLIWGLDADGLMEDDI